MARKLFYIINFDKHDKTQLLAKLKKNSGGRVQGHLKFLTKKKLLENVLSHLKPLYQSEAWCITFHMKMSLTWM